mmetsp:Transcript_38165/g.92822  ORF Transcript_38165/g.92822 Transcript_38165/m.92822 type:complete len:236 (+) Transcript_38165:91-798(+)|eukprot:CAMPEP_0113457916 /NCGR_PEP_ID=MMETSP0014_2-20120614/9653_1 /TAXON_ID=2857 /ORGANISM="Nitzschia sp." /LENGTH=235 /DNA_ID=CAMNT_0000349423 /DNA_START=50 /DNA_END=757 /DNA_ORIENTATION=+ /assembly_acc=CAM_ASM_000159
MMVRSMFLTLCILLGLLSPKTVVSWSSSPQHHSRPGLVEERDTNRRHDNNINKDTAHVVQVPDEQRRSIFSGIIASAAAVAVGGFQGPAVANAIPMVTADEFGIILRDSPRSVRVVEFSGPKSETVVVKLVDGTTFGIKDIVESSSDPRSPLKVQAACRENGVATKFADLEAVLAKSTTLSKKKLYTNQRVRDAQQKELERLERIRQDEEARQAQLALMEKDEQLAKDTAASSSQ